MGVLNTTPASYANGSSLTSTKLNTEVRDAFTTIQSAWTAYTPTLTATTTNPTLGNSALEGAYHRVGKTIFGRLMLLIGSTFVAGSGQYKFGLPVAGENVTISTPVIGGGYLYDNSIGGSYNSTIRLDATNTQFIAYYPVAGATYITAHNAPFVWAVSDQLNFYFHYEAL